SFVNILFSVTDKNNKGVDYLENIDFEVLENGNAISPSESFRYVKKLNQVPSKQKTVLMLDKSFSIRNDLPKIKQAALSLINQIADDQEIAIYAFSEAPILITDFTSDKAILEAAVNFIEVDFPTTNLYGSIITGLSRINNSYTLDGIEEGYLVVLTDGDDTQASSTLEEVITARGNKKVFMMGLGSDLNEDNLNEIAFPGNYVNAVNADELEDKFKQVRLDMLRFSNSFYWLNYMTPKRNSSNSLTVKAKTNTNTEIDKEITSTFSADGFESILFGVYANVEVGKKYGIEKLDIIINGSNPVFPVDFKAITFWAEDVPKFTWEIDNNDDFNLSINPNDDSKAILEILNNKYSVGNKLTLKDITNNYEKVIDVNLLTTLPALNVDTIYVKSRDFKVKGELLYQGQSEITEKGFKIYNENTGLIRDIKLDVNQSFEATVNGSSLILPNKYHSVVAYAKNTQGQGFSKRIYFLTKEATPLVNNTWQSFKVKAKSFKARGFLIDNGGLEIEEVGIVWSKTSEYPTIEDSKVMGNFTNLTSDNDFEAIIDNLEISTLYYFRSYAKNAKGISYSNILKQQNAIGKVITTNGLIESNVIGTQERKVDIDKATFSGNFGTNEVIVKTGFVWSETEELPELMNSNFTEINPNITESDFNKDNYELEGDIENLKPDTKYYIRLFIETDIGISYGNVLTFTTKKLFLSTQMSMSA
ncbi:MAG: VWA domain-containing protein, partial [Flavobacteriales bacterium]